jgi:hypothetical protein
MTAKSRPFRKDDRVVFTVQRGEHNMLAGRPGIVEGHRGPHILVRCTEEGTIFNGEVYQTPRKNVRHAP